MTPELVFRLCNSMALTGWIALILSPGSARWSDRVRQLTGFGLPLLLSAVYGAMLLTHWRGEGGFGTPAEVRALFDVPGVLVAGWVHYLAFDLFVGSWIARESTRLHWPHALLVPVLVLCFLFGPLGLLAFGLLRALRSPSFAPAAWLQEALTRQRALTVAALLIWAAMLPTLLAWGMDERLVRGVNVWVKPLKFMASIGLFWISTAWFVGLLPDEQRRHPTVRRLAAVAIAAGLFEIVYITWQAARGEASHFNFSSVGHQIMYTLMGLGALAMTATQPVLAWRIARHGRSDLPPLWREAVVVGLVATFVMGAGAGGVLGSFQPPAGVGLPVFGWHLDGGDLRPAHFLGMHAQQFIPWAGALLVAWAPTRGRIVLWSIVAVYAALWIWAMVQGLHGAVLTAPPMALT